jgi:hypothetical protein
VITTWDDMRQLDPTDRTDQERARAWLAAHDGESVYASIKNRVATEGCRAVMIDAMHNAKGDCAMLMTWTLAMRAARELLASN